MVHVSDILDSLVARSSAPSTMGAQLDRVMFGIQLTPDPFRQKADAEDQMLQEAVVIRCIDTFSVREEFSVTTRQRKAADAGFKVLTKLHDRSGKPQGSIAIGILRAYHERCTCSKGQSEERGLVSVYQYLTSIAPDSVPPPPKNEPDLVMAFRTGVAKRARAMACEAYADALLALSGHVRAFNKKEKEG